MRDSAFTVGWSGASPPGKNVIFHIGAEPVYRSDRTVVGWRGYCERCKWFGPTESAEDAAQRAKEHRCV